MRISIIPRKIPPKNAVQPKKMNLTHLYMAKLTAFTSEKQALEELQSILEEDYGIQNIDKETLKEYRKGFTDMLERQL